MTNQKGAGAPIGKIPGIDQSLEIHRLQAIHCPVNGTQSVDVCTSTGSYVGKNCPFYKGKKTLTDLAGEKFETVQCTAELYRRQEMEERDAK